MKPLLALFALILASSSAQEVTTPDLLGRTVTLPQPATRIVPTNSTALGQMLALGLEPAGFYCSGATPAVYVKREMNMTIPAATPCTTNAEGTTDWEKVAALKPDLIIGWDREEATVAEAVAPFFSTQTFAVKGQGDSFEMYDKSLKGIARLTGREAVAEAVLSATRDRAEAYADLAPDDLSVLHMGTFDGKEFYVFAQGSLNCQLLSRIADCAAPETPKDYYISGSSEMLLSLDPDVILFDNSLQGEYANAREANEALLTMLEGDALWQELRAVQENRVLFMPYDARADSIWGITSFLDTVAPMLYPDTFPAPLTDAQVRETLSR